MENSLDLEAPLERVKKNIRTDAYPMSIGEIVSMYKEGEIILRPEYQRYFRWTVEQKSKLIESILIGLPLPSFFVAQDEAGKWEVVDGMQRISTILEFMGILKPSIPPEGTSGKFKTLTDDLFYLKEFAKKSWDDFPLNLQRDFKRTKMQMMILMRASSLDGRDAKFELFQRLNSSATAMHELLP